MRFLFLFLAFCSSQTKVDGLVAVVGNNIVLHSDVLQQAQLLAATQNIDPSQRPYLFEKMYVESLENIINQYVVLDVAEKDTNLIVSDDEVDRSLDDRINEFILQAGSEELLEAAVGMSLRQIKIDYWHEIRNMMLIERYKFSKIQGVDISRIEVNHFYNDNKDSMLAISENYTFSIIEIPFVAGKSSEDRVYSFLDSLRSLVVGGDASFDSLATIYSQDPGSSSSGGRLGFTDRGTLVYDYEEAAYALLPGELSRPVHSQFGYHLIRLIDKRGEKISSQHILINVPFSDVDKNFALNKINDIFSQTNNDPFLFDSLSIVYKNDYNNFSGVYVKLPPDDIPSLFLAYLNNSSPYSLSQPIASKGGYSLLYFYEFNNSFIPSPKNSWNLIYQFAKQEKQNKIFIDHIEKIKATTYIKRFF